MLELLSWRFLSASHPHVRVVHCSKEHTKRMKIFTLLPTSYPDSEDSVNVTSKESVLV